MQREDDLTTYFEQGYDAGHIFQHPEYTFVQENWGYHHGPTKITVWADVLDLRTGTDPGNVYYHYTNHLAYLNITNEAKEKVELFASLNTDVEGQHANAWWGKGIYSVPKAPHEWQAPPERPEWSAIDTLLDNNFRSMMARDLEQGIDVEKKYPPRAQFCIPVLVNSWMAYDVSKERTPEMVEQGKEPGVNLANKRLNVEGQPQRVCVVIRNQTAKERQEPTALRPSKEARMLAGRGSLLQRVESRLAALESSHEESQQVTEELVLARWRLGQVYDQQGRPKEAQRLFLQVLKERFQEQGVRHPDTMRALIEHAASLKHMGHFAIAHDQLMRCLRYTSDLPDRTKYLKIQAQHVECACQLGRLHMEQQNMRHAETLFIEAYATRARLFGKRHFKTLDSLQDLATVRGSLLNHEDAELCSRKAAKGFTELLGPDHPGSLHCRLCLAETLVILQRFDEALELYEGEGGVCAQMARQLGAEHPKTRSADVSLMKASCQQGKLRKAYRLWLKKAKHTGLVHNSGLLFDLLFRYASHKGFAGILLMVLMGVIAWVPFALPSLRMAGLTTWPWIYTILPFWAFQSAFLLAIAGVRRTGDAKDEMEKAVVEHGRELDTLSVEVTVALFACGILLALRLDAAAFSSLTVGSPWLMLELLWLALQWRAVGVWGLCPPWHAALRVTSVIWLCVWADEHLPWLPWFTVIIPALLMVFISLVRVCLSLGRIGPGPVVSSIAIARSVGLQSDVFRGFTALIYSAVLVSFLYASEVEPHLMLAVPSLGLVFMPSTALLALKFNCFIQRLRFEDLRFSWAQAGESWVDAGTSPAP